MSSDLVAVASSVHVEWRKWHFGGPGSQSSWGEWESVADSIKLKEYDNLAVRWDGPSRALLYLEGIEPISCHEEWQWTEKNPLWFPGEYRMQVRMEETCLWQSRVVVSPQNPAFQHYGPTMAEELEAWIPGITQEFEGGVVSHAKMSSKLFSADLNLAGEFMKAMERALMHLEGEFRWVDRGPRVSFNTRDNRSLLKALFWAQGFIEDRIQVLQSSLGPGTSPDRNPRLRQLYQLQQASTRLLRSPFWQGVDRPAMDDRPTQRAYRRRSYRKVFASLQALQHMVQGPSNTDPGIARIRSTPEMFELWVLYQLLIALSEEGWTLINQPLWAKTRRWQGFVDYVSLKNSQFLFIRGEWTLRLDYDTPLPDSEDDTEASGGLWVSGPHNRPDFLLRFQIEGMRPKVRIFEAKYRPRYYVWPDRTDARHSSKGQLQQYWASLMDGGEDHLHPPVVCVIPQQQSIVWRAAQHPDVEFLAMNPTADRDRWNAMLTRRLVPGAALEGSASNV